MVTQSNILESGMNIMSKYNFIKIIIRIVYILYFSKYMFSFIFLMSFNSWLKKLSLFMSPQFLN